MINVTKTYLGDIDQFKRYVEGIYARGWLTNHGPLARELTDRLKDYLGVRHIILTNNGTLALQVAYRALGLSGSAVTTPFSFVATSSSLQWEGIRPIFADIDAHTGTSRRNTSKTVLPKTPLRSSPPTCLAIRVMCKPLSR